MGSPVEFPLRAWRRPVRYGLLLWLAVMMWFPATGGLVMLHVGRALALLGGTAFAGGVIAWILHKDHREIPAGSLRLDPSRLTFTARLGAALELRPADVRDLLDEPSAGALMIRRKSGPPSVIIDPARLGVPVAVVKAAVAAWVAEAGDDFGAAFANETARAQERNARRMKVMRWCGILAAACAALRLAAMLVEGK